MTDSVTESLLTQLQKQPRDETLLELLIPRLLGQGEAEMALQQAQEWLRFQPTSPRALGYALQACEMLGDTETAQSYQTLISALDRYLSPPYHGAPQFLDMVPRRQKALKNTLPQPEEPPEKK
ncbi:hypothetical protein [Deinococcus cellulosilyticus]|uniref:Tetratricopeptide repeat protein n=1 Tax=Deinococcus cellulosilyticus (strain DSM 18568 / NBRC 106333 / KACC 11606 / 5516J-15) TaxID=1223518 RepID=A0A511N6E2_DEIC1|nr:hypothetical protein [Deinococcus cellulosilyticus]GEM48413.1 hypothetical protein DC3_40480 [Deinococcus cellulosilyticus NBRC 106333 = KACC 11606]